jgi:hypothetical protein
MTGFAPNGTRLVEHLGIGTVFEVALVLDQEERELVCKRVTARDRCGGAVWIASGMSAGVEPHLVTSWSGVDDAAFPLGARSWGGGAAAHGEKALLMARMADRRT